MELEGEGRRKTSREKVGEREGDKGEMDRE